MPTAPCPQVFAPLAKLLGMYTIKAQLEELAFLHSEPQAHADTLRWFTELQAVQGPVVLDSRAELQGAFDRDEFLQLTCAKVEVQVTHRELFAVHRKCLERASPLENCRDVSQLRIVATLKKEHAAGGMKASGGSVCYHILGLVHALWKPIPGRMKDYIATPKTNGARSPRNTEHSTAARRSAARRSAEQRAAQRCAARSAEWHCAAQCGEQSRAGEWFCLCFLNRLCLFNAALSSFLPSRFCAGYRALHTQVLPFGSADLFPLELQIRTDTMHRMAECGIAADPAVMASWHSSARLASRSGRLGGQEAEAAGLSREDIVRRVGWLNSIREWQEEFVGCASGCNWVATQAHPPGGWVGVTAKRGSKE